MKKLYALLALGAALAAPLAPAARANNLQITQGAYSINPGPQPTLDVVVNVGWENSWRDSVNWDAVWLFVKYRRLGGPAGSWRTATLSSTDADFNAPAGMAISAATDGKGVFLYRAVPGEGLVVAPAARLRWNIAADGVLLGTNDYEYRVYGVEMVRIPQGPFSLNTTDLPTNANEFQSAGGSASRITSESFLPSGSIRWVNETGGGGGGNTVFINGTDYAGSAALGAVYPKGYAASYCMKYEVSQGQYTDFLNTLTRAQQISRVAADITGNAPAGGNIYVMGPATTAAGAARNTITCPAGGLGTTAPVLFNCTRPNRAGNSLIWADGAAYLDWAGLRPMSELEYEKICRGPLPPLPGEHAWGLEPAVAATSISAPATGENGTETTDPTANAVFNNVTFTGGDGGVGPLRGGIFATATSTRAQAGATYYGVLEMSGNCWERCVTVAELDAGAPTNAGAFDGQQNGDGQLDSLGNHNVSTWPNSTDVRGSGFRGGNWSRPTEWAMTADRIFGGSAISGRTPHRSIRGVRSQSSLSAPAQGTSGAVGSATKFHGGSYDGYDISPVGVVIVAGIPAELNPRRAVAFPNPTTGAFRIRLQAGPALTDATLILTDALGRPVRTLHHLHGADVLVERAALVPGLYAYRLTENGEAIGAGRVVVE